MLWWARRILVFLLLGAIVNVAVAWGFALLGEADRGDFFRSHSDDPSWYFFGSRETGSDVVFASDWPWADVGWPYSRADVPRWSMVRSRPTDPEGREMGWLHLWVEAAHGWPRVSMVGRIRFKDDWETISETHAAIPFRSKMASPPGSRFLPLRPYWPGFAVNAVFYSVLICSLAAGPFALRRWWRGRRGLCPACAYPRGTSPVCTECGEALPTVAAK